jgi:hypothetical protein
MAHSLYTSTIYSLVLVNYLHTNTVKTSFKVPQLKALLHLMLNCNYSISVISAINFCYTRFSSNPVSHKETLCGAFTLYGLSKEYQIVIHSLSTVVQIKNNTVSWLHSYPIQTLFETYEEQMAGVHFILHNNISLMHTTRTLNHKC